MVQELTAAPTPFVETLKLGKNEIIGWVGNILEDGTKVPETGAYIYVYINGFLINPPKVDKDGNYINVSKILSDKNGLWRSSSVIFDTYPSFAYGQSVYFKAKAKSKKLSNRSIPYVIGGVQTPINLGTMSPFNTLRAPYDKEITLYGSMSYWLYSVPPTENWYTEPQNILEWQKQYTEIPYSKPIQDGTSEIYVYSNDVYIGKVEKNCILGTSAAYPIHLPAGYSATNLSFIVDNSPVTINLASLFNISNITEKIEKTTVYTDNLVTTYFTCPIHSKTETVLVYLNGLRLIKELDYTISIDTNDESNYRLDFFNILTIYDKLQAVYYINSTYFVAEEILTKTSNTIYNLSESPYNTSTVRIYLDGQKLTNNIDYSITGKIVTFVFDIIDQVVSADYELQNTTNSIIVPVTLAGSAGTYSFPESEKFNITLIYRNGLLQTLYDDYNVIDNTIEMVTYLPGDIITAEQYNIPIDIDTIVTFLNTNATFKENNLTASTYSLEGTTQLKVSSPYTLDFETAAFTNKPTTTTVLNGSTSGSMTAGEHWIRTSFVYANGVETIPGPIAGPITISAPDSGIVPLIRSIYATRIELGGDGVVARKIYLTKADNPNTWFFAVLIPDNVTTSYLINVPDTYLVMPLTNLATLTATETEVVAALFGQYKLFPGKDTSDNFYFYFNNNTGNWKYTNLNTVSLANSIIEPIPFRRGQHLTARAYNAAQTSLSIG